MRTRAVMGQRLRVKAQAIKRLKRGAFKGLEQRPELCAKIRGGRANDLPRFVEMAEEANILADQRGDPIEIEMVAVQVREADGGDVCKADAGALETLCGGARADAQVDQHNPGG